MPYADLPALRLWYTDSGGSGAPVVALHALSGTTECWVHQQPAFTTAGYRFIAYDRRNWGRTLDGPAWEEPRTGSEDLEGLLNLLGLGTVHLVGTAAGGGAALDYALNHPDRLRSLVIADAVGGIQNPEYLTVQRRLRPPEIQALPIHLRELSAGYRGTNPEGTQRWIEIDRAGYHEGGREPPPSPMRPTLALLETLSMPVLMIAGEADLLTPPALMRMMAAHIPDCRFATVPEAGHAAFWEQPEIWNRLVLEFLNER